MDKKPSLENAYAMTTPQQSRELYRIWADRYDQDFAGKHDYIMPQLIARAFVDYGGKGRILDIGAGTGLVWFALAPNLLPPLARVFRLFSSWRAGFAI